MAQTLKINIVDLENVGLLFLGGAISVGINYRCKGAEKNEIEQQFQLRRQLRSKFPDDPRFKYYALFALSSEKPYFSAMPAPNQYHVTLDGSAQMPTTPTAQALEDETDWDNLESLTEQMERLLDTEAEEYPDDEA